MMGFVWEEEEEEWKKEESALFLSLFFIGEKIELALAPLFSKKRNCSSGEGKKLCSYKC